MSPALAIAEELQRQLALARDALDKIANGGTEWCAFNAGEHARKTIQAMESAPAPAEFCSQEVGPW